MRRHLPDLRGRMQKDGRYAVAVITEKADSQKQTPAGCRAGI